MDSLPAKRKPVTAEAFISLDSIPTLYAALFECHHKLLWIKDEEDELEYAHGPIKGIRRKELPGGAYSYEYLPEKMFSGSTIAISVLAWGTMAFFNTRLELGRLTTGAYSALPAHVKDTSTWRSPLELNLEPPGLLEWRRVWVGSVKDCLYAAQHNIKYEERCSRCKKGPMFLHCLKTGPGQGCLSCEHAKTGNICEHREAST